MVNKIWHPNDINSALWFIAGSSISGMNWQPEVIPKPGSPEFLNLPESFKKILRLDAPDLIATTEQNGVDCPIVSIEITSTTPQSQHAKQRVPRLVAAAEAGVPAIYIIPGSKMSGGSKYALGKDLYFGLQRIHKINDVPVLIYKFPDNNGFLLTDINYPNQPDLNSTEMKSAFSSIDRMISNSLNNNTLQQLNNDPWIKSELAKQAQIGSQAGIKISNYTTLTEIDTANLGNFLSQNTAMSSNRIKGTISRLPDRIKTRNKTLIFKPGGRMFKHAGDPYCGMLAFFDYAFCRWGTSTEERDKNLIYMPMGQKVCNIMDKFAPDGYVRYWQKNCPFSKNKTPTINDQFTISHHLQYGCVYTKTKPLRIYGYFSDMIVFQDSILVF